MTSNEELQSELDEILAPVRARILTLEHALEESVNARMRDRDAFEEELHRKDQEIRMLSNRPAQTLVLHAYPTYVDTNEIDWKAMHVAWRGL